GRDDTPAEPEIRIRVEALVHGPDQQERSDDHADQPRGDEPTVAADVHLGDEEPDPEDDEQQRADVHRKHLEGDGGDHQTDAAHHARNDGPRMEQLEHDADYPEHRDQVRDLGIGEPVQDLVLHRPGHVAYLRAGGVERALLAPAEIDLAPVDLAQELRQVFGDEIDRVQLERLGGGDALALPHRLLRPFDVARPALGDAFDERRGVVLQLLE